MLTAASRGANSFYLIEGLVFVSILMNLWGDTLLSMLKKMKNLRVTVISSRAGYCQRFSPFPVGNATVLRTVQKAN